MSDLLLLWRWLKLEAVVGASSKLTSLSCFRTTSDRRLAATDVTRARRRCRRRRTRRTAGTTTGGEGTDQRDGNLTTTKEK